MTQERRVDKLEHALTPREATARIAMCTAAEALSAEGHARYHAERGERCFTLNLGECGIREGG